ncbi:epimerase family protein SDR39U1 isoform X3 [Nycticebus coucang]|uniref:epimerase family protein SDR39U1 isoform X3 n=1 Tax=Nycticebus coucang TaxID=9470 RepID=UPI00234C9931|nr:epimerase family protein SDR39U1 isoform X3 [Nycticebus coucang]
MRVLVGGGTGFIGTALTQLLKAKGHEVTLVSRQPAPGRITWDELALSGLPSCDAAVNLAGENILNPLRRWNEAFQKEVLSSRLETTQMLAKAITKAPHPPRAWILVTGVAYYQPSLTAEYDEDSSGGDFDFFSKLVTKWEAAARLPGDSTRQVVVRSDSPGINFKECHPRRFFPLHRILKVVMGNLSTHHLPFLVSLLPKELVTNTGYEVMIKVMIKRFTLCVCIKTSHVPYKDVSIIYPQ